MPEQLRQGPATFAFDADGAVGSAATPQLGTPQVQPAVSLPGLTAQAPGVSDADSRTYRAIADLASGALAPKIKEAAQAQFLQGVQRAMTGEGLAEIVRDKPWYSDVFAPSSALVGARTYTAQRAVAQWGAKMAEQMPKLAQVGPEELQQAAQGALAGFMTGDPQADAMITASVVEQIGPLYKEHAKHHYLFVQKQATEQQIGAWDALGSVYQRLAGEQASGRGMVSPEDLEAGKARLLGAMVPFGDQSDDSYERNVSAFLEAAATGGNYHVVKLFKDSGMYAKIGAERRAALDRTINAAAGAAMAKAVPQFAVDIATLVHDTTQDPSKIPERVQALNAKAAALTGVTETELIPLTSLDNIIGSVMTAQRQEAELRRRQAMSAAEKEAEKLADVAKAQSQMLLGPGYLDACIAMRQCKEDAAETAGAQAYGTAKTPADKARILNSRTLKPFDAVKSAFVTQLRSPEYQPGIGEMSQVYAQLAEDVKTRYFDEHERAQMDRFNAMVRSGTPEAAAWLNSRSLGLGRIPESSKDPYDRAILAEVENATESRVFGINTLDAASTRMAADAAKKFGRLDLANNPPDVAAKRAFAQARANGLDIQGKHAIFNRNPADRPLYQVIGEGQQATAAAFEALMEERAKGQDVSLDDYMITRVPDRNGTAYFQVTASNKDGKDTVWAITSQEVKERVKAGVKVSKPGQPPAPPDAIGPSFGPFPRP